MRRLITIAILAALALLCSLSYAKGGFSGGGGRGGFSGSRAPSYSAPRAPSYRAPVTPRVTTTTTTTTSRTGGGGGYYGGGMAYGGMGMGYGYNNGLLTGLVIGNMLHPTNTVVYSGPGSYSNNSLLYPDGRVVSSGGQLLGTYQDGQFSAIQNGPMVAKPVPADVAPVVVREDTAEKTAAFVIAVLAVVFLVVLIVIVI